MGGVQGVPSPRMQGEGPWKALQDLEVQALKDCPAYGVRNVQIVAAGTGEALPGPAPCGRLLPEVWRFITDDLGK